ncbi:MAG: RRXRR domain-containing protein [Chlamydiota bacterium]
MIHVQWGMLHVSIRFEQKRKPLMPSSPCVARRLLESKKAKVVSLEPFTIKLLFGSSGDTQPYLTEQKNKLD